MKAVKGTPRHSPMEHPRHQYPEETKALQQIAKSCGLTEKIKWGKPCFTYENRNIALVQRFNAYLALAFFKGSLLQDPDKLLWRISDNMEVPRQMRFKDADDVLRHSEAIAEYLKEAIEIERSGRKAAPKPAKELAVPAELQARLDAEPAFRKAFASLTPGRQKGYLLHIAQAKQPATRAARVDRHMERILAGKGLHD